MNKYSIYAWLDDLQMTAHLAKVSTVHSYELQFCNNDLQLFKAIIPTAFIVDLGGLAEVELLQIKDIPKNELLTIIGYSQQIAAPQVKYFKEFGCHMVIGRHELLKNLQSILKKIFNAS